MTRRALVASLAAAPFAAAAASRAGIGIAADSFPSRKQRRAALEFLEYCHGLGAAGIQCPLGTADAGAVRRFRARCEEFGMYYEASVPLPAGDTEPFERALAAAKEAGAACVRSTCLSGRRYETFGTLEEWKRFVASAKERLERAVPAAERLRMPLAIENHKDWTVEEMLPVLRQYGSEYLGVCLDAGNNIALLDDPREVVEQLSPFAISTHIKDMGVAEYPEGFLLAEVPLGQGFLDVPWMVRTIAAARPRTRFTLEMITRSPLRIPCLTDRFWATFPDRNGRYLARTLTSVRAHPPARPLPDVDRLAADARAQLEEDNVRKCLEYAREKLKLKA